MYRTVYEGARVAECATLTGKVVCFLSFFFVLFRV